VRLDAGCLIFFSTVEPVWFEVQSLASNFLQEDPAKFLHFDTRRARHDLIENFGTGSVTLSAHSAIFCSKYFDFFIVADQADMRHTVKGCERPQM